MICRLKRDTNPTVVLTIINYQQGLSDERLKQKKNVANTHLWQLEKIPPPHTNSRALLLDIGTKVTE